MIMLISVILFVFCIYDLRNDCCTLDEISTIHVALWKGCVRSERSFRTYELARSMLLMILKANCVATDNPFDKQNLY